MVETLPLERAAAGYERMLSGIPPADYRGIKGEFNASEQSMESGGPRGGCHAIHCRRRIARRVAAFDVNPQGRRSFSEPARTQPSESATKFAKVVGWPENLTPKAPDGFQVEAFARDLESPRWLYVLPNGDVLVSQARVIHRRAPMPISARAWLVLGASLNTIGTEAPTEDRPKKLRGTS